MPKRSAPSSTTRLLSRNTVLMAAAIVTILAAEVWFVQASRRPSTGLPEPPAAAAYMDALRRRDADAAIRQMCRDLQAWATRARPQVDAAMAAVVGLEQSTRSTLSVVHLGTWPSDEGGTISLYLLRRHLPSGQVDELASTLWVNGSCVRRIT